MEKTDVFLKSRAIWKIKQSTIAPYDFQHTALFENDDNQFEEKFTAGFILNEKELPVCKTEINDTYWVLLTTRQIIGNLKGVKIQIPYQEIKDYHFGDFKGINLLTKMKSYTVCKIWTNGKVYEIPFEYGRASMTMMHGVMTLCTLTKGQTWTLK
jgi:hypothetical protein